MGAACVQSDAHQRQAVVMGQGGVVQPGFPDALSHTGDDIALVVGGIPEQQVGEGVRVLFRRAAQDSQILLGDAVLRHGGGELAGDIPAAGEQHDAAHRLIETVDGGDVIILTQGAVMLPQQGGHTGGGVAVLGQNTHGLDAEDEEFVLV